MKFDGKAFGADIVEVIKSYIDRENTFLRERLAKAENELAALKQEFAELPVPKDGEPGKDADLSDVAHIVEARTASLVDKFEKIQAQVPDVTTLDGMMARHVERQIAGWARPQDGKDADPEMVREIVVSEVERRIAAIPVPKDGRDGLGIADCFPSRDGELVITLENGTIRNVGRFVGEQGPPGPAGQSIKGDPGPQGEPGKDADESAVHERVTADIETRVAQIREDAEEFVASAEARLDKKLVTSTEAIGERIGDEFVKLADQSAALIAEKIAELPTPEPGAPGPKGEQGIPGKDADTDAIHKLITDETEKIGDDLRSDIYKSQTTALTEIDTKIVGVAKDLGDRIGVEISEIRKENAARIVTQVADVVSALPPAEKGERGEQGLPGRDADEVAIKAHVDEVVERRFADAIALLPAPEKGEQGPQGVRGEPGQNADPEEIRKSLSTELSTSVEKIAEDMRSEVATLKTDAFSKIASVASELGDRIGSEFVDLQAKSSAQITKEVGEVVAALPPAERGEQGLPGVPGAEGPQGPPGTPGRDGESPPLELVREMIEATAKSIIDGLPKPLDGHTPTSEEITALLVPLVHEAIKALPVPVSVAGIMIDRDGCLVVTLTNGDFKTLGPVVGKDGIGVDPELAEQIIRRIYEANRPKDGADGRDGRDGKDGVDGLSFADMELTMTGRTLTARATHGDVSKEWSFRLALPLYRGVYRDEEKYEEGDAVTYGGSLWIAVRDPTGKPRDTEDNGWKLAVKAGRDGKPGEPGKKGDPGAPGLPRR